MVKIKDFTLALKNGGGEGRAPVPYTPPAHGCTDNYHLRTRS